MPKEETQFTKGKSGNPSGRPKQDPEAKAIFRKHTEAAAKKLVHLMTKGKTENTQLRAATTILERGWGKPSQEILTPDAKSLFQLLLERIDGDGEGLPKD
jgi:hypothetical protein